MGDTYLDTRNNVAHVGHSHVHVVQAIQRQVARLNTNTRYLHPNMALLADRLIAMLPGNELDQVFFCNSGSEANDLALRLARAYAKGCENTIVVERAYHGHTLGTLQVSPYKFDKGKEHIHGNAKDCYVKVPCPDLYRGEFDDPITAGERYAEYVERACQRFQEKGEKVRAFIVEGGMSVAGVILPPKGYLSTCAKAVRAAGGLYIADEVQTGLGRLGCCSWAFSYHNEVVPDIVTMGKPMGNGMPLAALITTRKVTKAFEACGIEYFNTFAGNPVCTAAGLAVLDVLESENLQRHACEIGDYLKQKLLAMQSRLELIGDVRGSGLFLGIELVSNAQTLEPATSETSFICSQLKSKHKILTSIDGPYDNVLVLKPPMTFGRNEVDYFVECFENVATVDLQAVDLESISRTPT